MVVGFWHHSLVPRLLAHWCHKLSTEVEPGGEAADYGMFGLKVVHT